MKNKTNDLSMHYEMNDPLKLYYRNHINALKEFKDIFTPENIG